MGTQVVAEFTSLGCVEVTECSWFESLFGCRFYLLSGTRRSVFYESPALSRREAREFGSKVAHFLGIPLLRP